MGLKQFAEIAVYVAGVYDSFDYLIPEPWLGVIKTGQLVEVPFGKQKVQGIIMRLKGESAFESEIKTVSSIIDKQPVVTPAYIVLAEALSEKYFQPAAAYLMAMLPPGLSQRGDTLYTITDADEKKNSSLTDLQQRLIDLLIRRGPLRGRQIDRAMRHVDWRRSMRALVRRGLVQSQPVLPAPKASAKQINTVSLHPGVDTDKIEEIQTGREGSAATERRRKILRLLVREGEVVDVSYIYASTGASSADIRYLEKRDLVVVNKREVIRDPLEKVTPEGTAKPELTPDQRNAWNVINAALQADSSKPALLRGITGSGKTELYLRIAEAVEKAGKRTVVLVPEIALTPQTIQRFMDRFPGRVGVIHSRLSPGERYDTWRRARNGDFSVLVGPRSALFTPMPVLGAVILDECHDDSYYQEEMGPVYHSVEAALLLGKVTGAAVIFGSATPNVNLCFRAEMENWPVAKLDKRVATRMRKGEEKGKVVYLPLPDVQIVDMREELQTGNSSIFSRALVDALREVVEKKQQAILFLNRRGSATIVFCRECGYTAFCPRCDFPLTYHRDMHQLMCHTCGYTRNMINKCPDCGSVRIRQYGTGTKRVEDALLNLIPGVHVLRWDADTAAGKRSEAVILSHFKRHNADVLIGTQMVAKGLDLPLVTLVGAVLADVGLNFPDYRAGERAFQLLTQVAGRAGRSRLGGRAILQTFQPGHYAIQHAAAHDFEGFYQAELARRREIQYPPFTEFVRLETRDHDPDRAEKRAREMAERITELINKSADRTLQMIGPAPPFFSKRSGYFRWQIILKGERPGMLVKELKLDGWRVAVNPPDVL